MASETKLQLSKIEFSGLDLDQPGTDEWEVARAQVMHALEEHGCFEALYDKVALELREAIFGNVVEELFSLPLETKLLNTSDKYYHGYMGQMPGLDYESLALDNVECFEAAQSFTNLMWPGGNPSFCKSVWEFAKQVTELEQMVQRMVHESWGIEKHFTSQIKSLVYGLRVAEYGAPGPDAKVYIPTHTDTNFISIVCQNKVNGLDIRTKEGDWIHVTPTPYSFTVMVGDAFEAWCNRRLLPASHRVVVSGEETRHIMLFTSRPKDDHMVQAPEELVDEEHSLHFKPYYYPDYLQFRFSDEGGKAKNALKAFCEVEGEEAEVAA